jgi:hypothetical protein
MSGTKGEEILGMSDEDFAKMAVPGETANSSEKEEKEVADDKDAEDTPATENAEGDASDGEPDKGETESSDEADKGDDTQTKGEDAGDAEAVSKTKPKTESGQKAGSSEPDTKSDPNTDGGEAKTSGEAATAVTPEVLADFYKRVVETPIKANGKTIKLNNADEAIGLMQMGANYTRKMQELAPYRKAMTMLNKHGLLDENELSFLIDIKNKNPDAIRKLVKDAGIDPIELSGDDDAGKKYQGGNHRVTDAEVRFQEGIDGLKSTPEGQATLSEIHTNWDDASKDLLWENPGIMSDIHIHRENGFYAMVTAEMNRQKVLGKIPASTPFLVAYKMVGDQFVAANNVPGVQDQGSPAKRVDSTAKPVVTGRTTATKPVVSNPDKAAAAASTRSTTKVSSRPPNPLAMADDEFMKAFNNRL